MSVSEPGKIITPWAESGLKNPIPPAANPTTGRAGFDQGFPAINMTAKEAGGVPPFGQDFNGILYEVTNILRYMQAGGQPTFNAALATAIGGYPKGAVVLGSDGVTQYRNQTDGNTNNPDVTLTGWTQVISNPYPVGAPIPWPTAVPPSGFLAMTGQSFSSTTYPKLALAYPSLVLPDMRAFSIRGFDAGRGIDAGRVILSEQGDAGRELTGSFNGVDLANPSGATGVFSSTTLVATPASESFSSGGGHRRIDFKASAQIPVANEFRIKTIAFFYVVRAV